MDVLLAGVLLGRKRRGAAFEELRLPCKVLTRLGLVLLVDLLWRGGHGSSGVRE